MLKTRILLLSTMSPAIAWAASAKIGPSLLIVQVICAIAVCFALFMVILRATEHRNTSQLHPSLYSQPVLARDRRFSPR